MVGLWERIRERNSDTDPIIEGLESPLQEAARDIYGSHEWEQKPNTTTGRLSVDPRGLTARINYQVREERRPRKPVKRKATTQVTFQTKRIMHLDDLGKAKRTLQLATKYMQNEGYEPQEKLIAKGPEEAPRLSYPMRSTHTPTLEDVQRVMADTTEALREAYSQISDSYEVK